MTTLPPLETCLDLAVGEPVPLPSELATVYGSLCFDRPAGRPLVISNFVTTLDGVVSLNAPGQSGGGEISGNNEHDRFVMGILRAVADAVVVGAGTLRAVPHHLWTAEYIYAPLADAYRALRAALGKIAPPLNVVVSASGVVDLDRPVFGSGQVPALIVTTPPGARRLSDRPLPPSVRVQIPDAGERISARAILAAIGEVQPSSLILVEGGPRLLADFLAERCLDELFLTLAPQIAGRDDETQRPGLVVGRSFAPGQPIWGQLVSLKRAGSHLFLRYGLPVVD